jgi:hypothetical protein
MIERGINPCEIIEERPPKEIQAFRPRNRCRHQNTGIDLEPIIQQQETIAIRLQQRSDARPKGDPQFMHRLPERRPSLFVFAPAPQQCGQPGPQNLTRPGKRKHCEHCPRLARTRQNASPGGIQRLHCSEQGQTQHRLSGSRLPATLRQRVCQDRGTEPRAISEIRCKNTTHGRAAKKKATSESRSRQDRCVPVGWFSSFANFG